MAKRVAELIVEVLANAGVERVFGLSGDSLNGITGAIRKQKLVRWVHVRHERNGGLRSRRRSPSDGKPGSLHGELRSRQPAPDQRSLRLPSQPRTRACHCRSDSKR
jgi:hypothetical protein